MSNKQFSYQIGHEIKTVTVARTGDRFRVLVGETEYSVAVGQHEPGVLDLEVDGRQWHAHIAQDGPRHYVAVAGEAWVLEKAQPQWQRSRGAAPAPDAGSLEASMPGLVREVLAMAGAEVNRGDTLVVLEAMKMELRLTAPYSGWVRRVHCVAGQAVERGQVLVEMEKY